MQGLEVVLSSEVREGGEEARPRGRAVPLGSPVWEHVSLGDPMGQKLSEGRGTAPSRTTPHLRGRRGGVRPQPGSLGPRVLPRPPQTVGPADPSSTLGTQHPRAVWACQASR